MGMPRSPTTTLLRDTVRFLLGIVALAALTGLCFWLDLRLVSASFAFLILIVLLSLADGFISLAALSIVAVGCLNFFFAPPVFDFRVDYPEDIITVAAFWMTALIVTGLMRRTRVAKDEQILAAEKLRHAQLELAHANRVATVGQMTASIAHEVNQPIGALVTNAYAALRWLRADPPDLGEASQALEDIIKDGRRVSDVIDGLRALVKKAPPKTDLLDINDAIMDTIALARGEILKHRVALETQLATDLPPIRGDRVQLQQVIMNLVVNAVEAMTAVDEGTRELQIGANKDQDDIHITVRDAGPPLKPESLARFFEAFHSTKPGGMGMGLSICRAIIEAHQGRIWATANVSRGATLHVTLPASRDTAG
jgi:C4-dicarboxylate-specific signal transduction histidine kinase